MPPYPLPRPAHCASVVRAAAEAVVAELREPASADSMFAASPRFPPPGDGWRPLPHLSTRVSVRAPWIRIGDASGAGYGLLRYALLTLANVGVVELSLTPMSSSAVGRVRFVRLCRRGDDTPPLDLAELIPDPEPREYLYSPRRGV